MGKARSFVSKYEHGERRLSFSEVLEACHWLGLHEKDLIDAIYGGDMKRSSPSEAPGARAEMLTAEEQGKSADEETGGTLHCD